MTLIVGIKCGTGVVIGADSMVSFGSSKSNVQMNSLKIRICGNDGIAAFAGDMGMSQIAMDSMSDQWDSIDTMTGKNKVKERISHFLHSSQEPYYNLYGGAGDDPGGTSILVAVPIRKKPVLTLFEQAVPMMEAKDGIYFLTAGLGANLADSFLKFLEKSLWRGKPPVTIGRGVFSTLWTLNHVIEANAAMGVGGNPSIAVLELVGKKWASRVLQTEEIELHQEQIVDVEESLSDFWGRLN